MFRYGKETAVFAIIVFAAIAIAILLVADNKDNPVLLVLFILFVTTLFWIVKPFGISIGGTSCLLLALFMLLGIPNEIVFSGFMESSVWTMIPALFFGYALKKTGLGRRLVSYVLGHIGSLSYFKLIAAWFVIGVILSLLTPSITVRVIIVIPLAMETVDLCGIPKNSKGRSLILLSAWSMSVIPGIGWYTGSLLGPVISGIFSSVPEIPAITPSKWLSICLLPTAIVTVLLLIMSYFFLKPDSNLKKINNPFKTSKYPKISFDEKSSLIILLAAFVGVAELADALA